MGVEGTRMQTSEFETAENVIACDRKLSRIEKGVRAGP